MKTPGSSQVRKVARSQRVTVRARRRAGTIRDVSRGGSRTPGAWRQRPSSTWRTPRLRSSHHLKHTQRYAFSAAGGALSLPDVAVAPQGAPPHQRRNDERAVLPGLHTDSESGSALSASSSDSAQSAGGVVAGSWSPAAALLSARRLRRTRVAMVLLQRLQWALLRRTREYHRRFVIRSGHIGSREGHHAATVRRDALRQTQLRCCASPGCEALAMELCTHCFAHVCLERGQQLYRLVETVPRLVTEEDSDVEEVSDEDTPSAAAPASEFESGAGMGNGQQSSVSNSET